MKVILTILLVLELTCYGQNNTVKLEVEHKSMFVNDSDFIFKVKVYNYLNSSIFYDKNILHSTFESHLGAIQFELEKVKDTVFESLLLDEDPVFPIKPDWATINSKDSILFDINIVKYYFLQKGKYRLRIHFLYKDFQFKKSVEDRRYLQSSDWLYFDVISNHYG